MSKSILGPNGLSAIPTMLLIALLHKCSNVTLSIIIINLSLIHSPRQNLKLIQIICLLNLLSRCLNTLIEALLISLSIIPPTISPHLPIFQEALSIPNNKCINNPSNNKFNKFNNKFSKSKKPPLNPKEYSHLKKDDIYSFDSLTFIYNLKLLYYINI